MLTAGTAGGHTGSWTGQKTFCITNSYMDKRIRISFTALHDKNVSIINGMGRTSKNVMKVFTYLEENPIIEMQKTAVALSLSFNTIASAVGRLCEEDILIQTSNVRRNRTFSYEAYLQILRSGTQ